MIEIHWPILLAQAVTFLAAVYILWKFAWGPLTAFMDQRRQEFQKQIDEQKRKGEELIEIDRRYNVRLAQMKREAEEMMSKAAAEGRQIAEQLLANAHLEAKKMLENAQAQIGEEKEKAIAEVRKQGVGIAVQIAEKIMREKVDKKMQEKLEVDFFKGLGPQTRN
jgi:F-type H+-transporting ATPase subunit b